MSHNLVVSVIIPTYNRRDEVVRAVRSVMDQTYPKWECIVVDDGSTDATETALGAMHQPRIRCIYHRANKGASAARNTGVAAARGEYVAFLDSDDEWLPEKLERQLPLFDRSPVLPGLTYTAAWKVDAGSGEQWLNAPMLSGDVFRDLLYRQHINFSTVIARTDLVRKIGGFDESLPRGMDRDLLIRLASLTPFDGLRQPLARLYQNHGPHLKGSVGPSIVYKRRMLEKLETMPGVPRSALSYQHRSLGRLLLETGSYRESGREMLSSIRYSPANPKTYSDLVRVGWAWISRSTRWTDPLQERAEVP